MLNSSFYKKYLLPGFIFQSITVGGGYGTGRELVEFFLTQGPLGGLLGMVVATIIWSIVLATSFELSRRFNAYDYRTFIESLLGKGWMAYEIVYATGMILVVSVLGSAAGEIFHSMFGLDSIFGIILMMIFVAMLAFYGSSFIEKVLSVWSLGLYGAFIVLIIFCISEFLPQITENIRITKDDSKWFLGGVKYSAYNIGIIPAMIFVVRHIESRTEAFVAGSLGGVIAIFPGILIYISMLSAYPSIVDESVPVDYLLDQLDLGWFQLIFRIILFGTFIETGVGLIHGFNERVASVYSSKGKVMPAKLRIVLAVGIMVVSVFAAKAIGLVELISKGYTALTWGYMIAFVIPVLTYGIWKLRRG